MDNEEMILSEETAEPTAESAEESAEELLEDTEPEGGDNGEEPAPASAPSAEETAADTSGQEPETAEPARYPVSYGEDTRELTVDELTAYAQRGMQYDEIAPAWNDLCRMASERGETPQKLIGAIAAAEERVLYERLLREANGNRSVADRLMEHEKSKRQTAAATAAREKETAAENAKQAQTDRLAAEYLELKAEFPELADFKDIPKAVVETAVKSKMHLLDAYLRYRHTEDKKIAKNDQTKAAAAATAMGSMSADAPEPDSVDPFIQAMLEGVNAAL